MSDESAKRFAGYVIDVINHATSTGETAPLREISLPRCQSCHAITRNVGRIYSKGGRFYGKGIDLEVVSNTVNRPDDRPVLDLGTYFNPEVVRIPGEKAQRRRGGKQPLTLYLRWRDGGWKVERLDVVQ